MSYLALSSAHKRQDADIGIVLVHDGDNGLKLAFAEVLVLKAAAQQALGSRPYCRLFHIAADSRSRALNRSRRQPHSVPPSRGALDDRLCGHIIVEGSLDDFEPPCFRTTQHNL